MKKLRLNKIFHWLYAFLMLYPIFIFFGLIVIFSFNSSFVISDFNISPIIDSFNEFSFGCIGNGSFASGSILSLVDNAVVSVVENFGFDLSDNTIVDTAFGLLFVHWIEVSLFYLLFDVLMYPINLFHKWIDEGGI